MTIAGRSKAAARAGGHSITVQEGTPFMFGGMDALGAQVSQLLKLKRIGPARWEHSCRCWGSAPALFECVWVPRASLCWAHDGTR